MVGQSTTANATEIRPSIVRVVDDLALAQKYLAKLAAHCITAHLKTVPKEVLGIENYQIEVDREDERLANETIGWPPLEEDSELTCEQDGASAYRVRITRDEVHASDSPQEAELVIGRNASIGDLLRIVREEHFLASITGGRATWAVCERTSRKRLGVVAQEWTEAKLTVPRDLPLSELFGDSQQPSIDFWYCTQHDPVLVFEDIVAGRPLPR